MEVSRVPRRRRPDLAPRLWPAWAAIGGALLVAVVGAVVVYAMLSVLLVQLDLPILSPARTTAGREERKLLVEASKAVLGLAAAVGFVLTYRRHRIEESQSHRDDQRLFTDRFGSAAEQLGHAESAVRLAGVYAMVRLADDWYEQRQTCIDVLSAYLRLPVGLAESSGESPDRNNTGAATAPGAGSLAAEREVRRTIVRLIAARLRIDPTDPTRIGWHSYALDFTGVVFDANYDFGRVQFSGGQVSFRNAEFSGGIVSFDSAEFSGGEVSFAGAEFSGGEVSFAGAEFSGGIVSFDGAEFSGGEVSFDGAQFLGGEVSFNSAQFSGGAVSFRMARFSGGRVDLSAPASWDRAPQFDEGAPSASGLLLPRVVS